MDRELRWDDHHGEPDKTFIYTFRFVRKDTVIMLFIMLRRAQCM